MLGSWTTHYEGEVEGRPVNVQTHSEGGYRVKTAQGADDEGTTLVDESTIASIPPTAAGRLIDIDGETIDEVRKQLKQEGFGEEAIAEIAGHFPA